MVSKNYLIISSASNSRGQVEITRESEDGKKLRKNSNFKLKNRQKFPGTTKDSI